MFDPGFTTAENISKLQEILAEFGFLEDACIKTQIQCSASTSTICEFEIEPTSNKTSNTLSQRSLKAFKDAVRDKYLNPALEHLDANQKNSGVDKTDGSTTVVFKCDNPNHQYEISLRYTVCLEPCSISPTGCCRYG